MGAFIGASRGSFCRSLGGQFAGLFDLEHIAAIGAAVSSGIAFGIRLFINILPAFIRITVAVRTEPDGVDAVFGNGTVVLYAVGIVIGNRGAALAGLTNLEAVADDLGTFRDRSS